jgi:hypothetical protein
MFIFKIFLDLANSSSEILSLSLLSSSKRTEYNSYECDPGPSILIPKSPESEKCELRPDAPSTKLCLYIRFVIALQYIPLPGPPDENDVAFPINVFMT